MPKAELRWIPGRTVEPKSKKFEVVHGDPALLHGGGIVGGGNAVLQAEISLAPSVRVSDDAKKLVVFFGEEFDPPKMRSAVKVLKRSDPGGLALLGWSMDLGFMDMASEKPSNIGYVAIAGITVKFDKGEKSAKGSSYVYELPLPPSAQKAKMLLVDFAWLENAMTLEFPLDLEKEPLKIVGGKALFPLPGSELAAEAGDVGIII